MLYVYVQQSSCRFRSAPVRRRGGPGSAFKKRPLSPPRSRKWTAPCTTLTGRTRTAMASPSRRRGSAGDLAAEIKMSARQSRAVDNKTAGGEADGVAPANAGAVPVAEDSPEHLVLVVDSMPDEFRDFLNTLSFREQCILLINYVDNVMAITEQRAPRYGRPPVPPIEWPWMTDEDVLRWAAAATVLQCYPDRDQECGKAALDALVKTEWEIWRSTTEAARKAFRDRVRDLTGALDVEETFSSCMAALDQQIEYRKLAGYGALNAFWDALESARLLPRVRDGMDVTGAADG